MAESWKKLTASIPVSSEIAEDYTSKDAISALLERKTEEMIYALQEDLENHHIGPKHRPGRNELRQAQTRLRNAARWSRAHGKYIRVPREAVNG